MTLHRRHILRLAALGWVGGGTNRTTRADTPSKANGPLKITGLKVTPIALPDPPLLAASGCHGPYFLRNVVEVETDAGIVGVGETVGGAGTTAALEKARTIIEGKDAFAYRSFAQAISSRNMGAYAGIELACLDACGKATGRRLCELLGGPVREEVEFAAYLFYRYASDHPVILADPHLADARGKGDKALDDWGEVRSPSAMAEMAAKFRERFGFRVFKLKGGVLAPEVELETMQALADRLGREALLRIDPNARWRLETALRIGERLKPLNLEYYEDPVAGQGPMAEVRQETGLKMSTNMCVTSVAHVPEALRVHPIDVLLLDHHYFGGIAACQALEPIAKVAGWTLSQHSNSHAGVTMAAMIHLAAVVPGLTCASDTHYPWLVADADILAGPTLPIRDGRMAVPAGAGLGVALDRDKVARAHEVYRKAGMARRDDGTLMRKLEPGWTGGLL
ncbi:MAG TPA: enolase C-terminal domain-like protein [Isosphaeraceae bacterium]|jgi:glucarate dehydratase|nr:enolase C-terminal domain-like protein [Isosphaeraceae bacterium]